MLEMADWIATLESLHSLQSNLYILYNRISRYIQAMNDVKTLKIAQRRPKICLKCHQTCRFLNIAMTKLPTLVPCGIWGSW